LQKGAAATAKTIDGKTPLDIAEQKAGKTTIALLRKATLLEVKGK
jgi:hypothetical protein